MDTYISVWNGKDSLTGESSAWMQRVAERTLYASPDINGGVMKGRGPTLSPETRAKVRSLLAKGCSAGAIAGLCGVSKPTVYDLRRKFKL